MNNQRKIAYNLFLGIASEVLTIILGIVVPRLILTSYGSEINGLLSSVTQIYSYIALLEAGVGTATVQALYKTIAKKNKEETNAVLAATNRYYHRTGLLYLIAILVLSIVFPLVINTDIPIITVVLIIVLNGLGSVINYFFQAKYFLLLQAEGKNYIKTSLTMFTNVFKNIAKIVLMALGFDVVFVQMIAMAVSLIQMLYITWYIKKYYGWIDLSVKPDYEAISQSKNVLVHQISGLIFNNTDMIVLSVFCGLKTASVYSMYTMLFGMISTALSTVSSSFLFSLGQMFHVDRERFLKLYDGYELFYMTLVFALYSVANFFILPFIARYTVGVNDVNYVDPYLPLLFISTFLLSCGRSAPNQVINFAGHFKLTQKRSIAESAINLSVSLIAVNFFGIYGVLFGTIAALLYRSNDIIIYASKKILHRSPFITYKRWGVNLAIFVLVLFVNRFLSFNLDSYSSIVLCCIPYAICIFFLFFGVAALSEPKTARFVLALLRSKTKRKR
ncbi:MAG: sugar isomerase [Faecousia sp.]